MEDRANSRIRWACAILASRMLRWRDKSRYGKYRRSCMRIQVVARMWTRSARVKSKLAAVRFRRAEEAVQALEVR